ncbi:MAG: hypothetical protein HC800_06550 [Phormidesmis sp. RL_2_1]|nr:hypothetical protein [Phormidesmis sp. RL_2_1]
MPKHSVRQPAVAITRVSAARSATQQSVTPNTRVSKPRRPIPDAASRIASRQAVVSVVPASESHPLDWTNGSLAHRLDIRPQRSAM